MRPIDYSATIGRTNDFSQLKQAENDRPIVTQQQITTNINKTVEEHAEQVNQKKDSDMDSEYDASREGRGAFTGEGNKQKKKKNENPDGTVVIKKTAGFDIKI